ncbi:hypothetical protein [Vibrio apostichopi]|uniref:hypothetical protein n=1 Tax=Vibrio apostichopi TaxID=3035453 RepID=UPI00257254D5|nr:hypothetical protein [Vibrio sp. FE10]
MTLLTSKLNYAFCALVLFFFLYTFRVPYLGNSAIIAVLISLAYVIFTNKLGAFLGLILHRNTIFYVGLVSTPFVYYLILTIFLGEMDFSYLTQYKRLVFYFFGSSVVSIFISSLVDIERHKLVKIFRTVVVIQLLIMLTAFFVPAFRELLALTKPEDLVLVANRYSDGGVRGLSLSGPQFFGLAVTLSFLLFLFVVDEYNNKNRTYMYMFYAFMLLFFMSAGRVILVAAVVFFVYLLCQSRIKSYSLVLRFLFFSVIAAIVMVAIYYLVLPYSFKVRIDNFIGFTFEFILNYLESGKLETSSTNHLLEMYFPISLETFVFGDGRYSGTLTGYYMNTDSGYMRQILASGIMSLVLFFFSTVYLLYFCAIDICRNNKSAVSGVLLSSTVLLLIFQYKGEVLGYFLNLHMILWVFYFTYRYKKINEY